MPKATAVWLIDNTGLTFEQIAAFCHLHHLEVKGIADGEVAQGVKGADPIDNGQLSREEFRAGWERAQQALQAEARLRQHFSTVDANKSGALEPAEYATLELVKKAGKDAPMSRFDANKDGKLQFGEYLRLVQALAPENAGAAK